MVDDSTVATFTPYALQRAVTTRRLYSRPVHYVAPWTYGTIGDRKRVVAARAEESGYLSGIKNKGRHHPRERRHGVCCVVTRHLYSRPVNFVASWTYGTIGDRKREVAARAEESGYLSGIKADIIAS